MPPKPQEQPLAVLIVVEVAGIVSDEYGKLPDVLCVVGGDFL